MFKKVTHAVDGNVTEVISKTGVSVGAPGKYSEQPGVLTFRGDPLRQNAAVGVAKVMNGKLKQIRSVRTQVLDEGNSGFGYGSQPVIIKWYKNIREIMGLNQDAKATTGLKEAIMPSDDGRIYFFDMDTQGYSRAPINIGMPMSVTASINPFGYPLLYVGQSVEKLKHYTGNVGLRIVDLIKNEVIGFQTGLTTLSKGKSNEVFSSPLISSDTDTAIYTGGNGMLYEVDLNTVFNMQIPAISVQPSASTYGYTSAQKKTSIGNHTSVAAYGNYAYFGDDSGLLQCVDMNTMTCIWARDLGDSIMACTAIEIEADGTVALYAGTVCNLTGKGRQLELLKINALTGADIWSVKTPYKAKFSSKAQKVGSYAGLMASPLIGKGDISDLVIFNTNMMEVDKNTNCAVVFALDKSTGEVVWEELLDATSESSPILILDETGKSFIVVGDDNGILRLMDGFTGATMDSVSMKSPIKSSPAAYGNHIIVGTTGAQVYFVDIE